MLGIFYFCGIKDKNINSNAVYVGNEFYSVKKTLPANEHINCSLYLNLWYLQLAPSPLTKSVSLLGALSDPKAHCERPHLEEFSKIRQV